MNYLSVCSGIEAATMAWHPLGWDPVAFSEIEDFPSEVLAQRHPDVPNLGDMTKHKEWKLDRSDLDVLVGGTPCQSFSVAGLRKGMDDPRGNLALVYLAIADRLRPRWVVWENVPGVLSSNGGRDFGAFLGGLAELGYGWAYRTLDAQYVRVESHVRAVPQRRRRVFVVGHLGGWQSAGSVLLERESLSGHSPPRREAGEGAARGARDGSEGGGREGGRVGDPVALHYTHDYCQDRIYSPEGPSPALNTSQHHSVAITVMSSGQANAEIVEDIAPTLNTNRDGAPIAFQSNMSNADFSVDGSSCTVKPGGGGGNPPAIASPMAVRRLTPRECERLMGFPDDYTKIRWRGKSPSHCPDGHRYRALGNSMAVNVMRWIGERIALADELIHDEETA